MQRVLTTYKDGDAGGYVFEIPEGAALTIITCCNECDFVVKTAGGKCACGNPRILAKRPYTAGDNNRSVIPEVMPPWCPLKERKDLNP